MRYDEVDRSAWRTYYPKPITPVERLKLGKIYDPGSAGLPAFCYGFDLRREPDGRLFAVGEIQGCNVFVQPKSWKDLTVKEPVTNYGVNLPAQEQAAGTVLTNDPNFGQGLLQSSTGSDPEAWFRKAAADQGGTLFGVGLLIVAAVIVWARWRKA